MAPVGDESVSAREAEVLAAVGEHLTNAEIAQRLHISIRTVESHVSSLLRKLDVSDRRALAAKAAAAEGPDDGAPRSFRGLPTTWTSFVGRIDDLADVATAVGEHRMVTLVGPGGIGKTRLAVATAERLAPTLAGGGAFVDLVPVDRGGLLSAVAAALDVVDQPQTPLEVVVREALRGGPALVVLDNCEHVLDDAAAWVEAALADCPELVVLATSRERLGVGGERVVAVPPLGDDAPALFVERAATGGADLDTDPSEVGDICGRLDGMPLAIELAAARVASLGVDGLLTGLDDHLRLLGRSADRDAATGRHRSLRAVIDWSHDLLDDEERVLFRRVAVFAGAFDLASATAVATDGDPALASDAIGRLADKSLLVRGRDGSTSRWRMLETVRAFAREELEASHERAATETAHLRWAVATAAAGEAALVEGRPWADDFDATADDLRAALARPAPAELSGDAHVLGLSLAHLCYARGLLLEAREHYVTAGERSPDPAGAVVAYRAAAAVARVDQRFEVNVELLSRAGEIAEAAGDRAAAARCFADLAGDIGRFPAGLAEAPDAEAVAGLIERARALDPGDDPEVRAAVTLARAWNGAPHATEPDPALADEALALAREVGDPLLISDALDAVASVASFAGRHKEAARLTTERIALVDVMARHAPEVGLEVFDAYHMATETRLASGDLEGALDIARRSKADRLAAAVPYQPASHLVLPLALRGDFDEVLTQAELMRDSWEAAGRPVVGWMAGAVFAVAMVHGLRGSDSFDDWWEMGMELNRRSSFTVMRDYVGQRVALHHGRIGRDELWPVDVVVGHAAGYAESIRVEVAVVAGEPDAEQRLHEIAPTAASENDYAAAILHRAAGRLHHDAGALEVAVAQWEALGARFERAVTLLLLPDRRVEGEAELAALGCPLPADA